MSARLYFAYGSNLDADQMRSRCPSAIPRFKARLDHHRLDFTHYSKRWQGGAADVVAHIGSEVWGLVYEMSDRELRVLDGFESGYERVQLDVIDDGRALHPVTSYSVVFKQRFAPTDLYLGKILAWGEHWQFPADYLERLRRFR